MGTIDPSRRGCPSVLVLQKKKMLRPYFPRGYGVWIRENRILFALWKDTKVVCVASTVYSGHSCNQELSRHLVFRRKWYLFLGLYLTTTKKREEYIYLISYSNIIRRGIRVINIGRRYFIIALTLLLQTHIFFTESLCLRVEGEHMTIKYL